MLKWYVYLSLWCPTPRLAGDPLLSDVSHVVVDEVHERTMQGDFLMALLKGILARRNSKAAAAAAKRGPGAGPGPLKVVLMSATLDAALYRNYFGGCPGERGGGGGGGRTKHVCTPGVMRVALKPEEPQTQPIRHTNAPK
jgi:hypothetical protein